MKRLPVVLLLLISPLTLPACSTNPATGRSQLNVIGPEEEVRIGEEAAPQFLEENGGQIPSPPIQEYVSDIGHRLAAVSERPDLPWEFYVLDSAQINAFALPGGKVFMSRGLLEKMDNEAQLAGVLGHEVGHVTAKHVNDRMAQAIGWGIAGAAIGAAGAVTDEDWLKVLGVGVGVGGGLYQLKFSRDQESESDALGVRYMAELGYNPVGQIQVMQILQREAGGRAGLEIFATHPNPGKRVEDLEKLIPQKYPGYDDPSVYRFYEDRFKQQVLDPLSKLPSPKHNPQSGAMFLPAELWCATCSHDHAARADRMVRYDGSE